MASSAETNETLQKYKEGLQKFQADRIRETYADLKENPQLVSLVHFFFEQIYGPQDFGFRDHGIRTLHRKLGGFLRGEIIDGIGKVIELNDLSDDLDNLMAEKMRERDIGPELIWQEYAEIYRSLDNYQQRVYQIDLTLEAIRRVHDISQMPFIGWSLKVVRKAARLAGYGKIMDFLYQGYEAFKKVNNIDNFTGIIEEREKALNDKLFKK